MLENWNGQNGKTYRVCPICHQLVEIAEGHAWYRWRFQVDDAGQESYVRDAEPEDYTHKEFCTQAAYSLLGWWAGGSHQAANP